ncbi:MAG: prepilin-type N-terminal cleavage/methylation domain-containing protein, partial [Candidatus Pacebacteria bacterium]|nr:prepilin-type N-terminal cleavage/methylation domain-containing protein [Candidatus Paceibacterota bacterium]
MRQNFQFSIFNFQKESEKKRAGFTLVEMLVSITIFALSMTVAIQLFAFSINAEKKMMVHSQLVNEISYNVEHITRGLRKAVKSEDTNCLSSMALNYEPVTHNFGPITTYGIKYIDPSPAGTADCVEYYMGYPGGEYDTRAALMEWRRNSLG